MTFFDDGVANFKAYVDGGIKSRDDQIAALTSQITSLTATLADRDATIGTLNAKVADLEAQLANSSGRTAPTPPADAYKVPAPAAGVDAKPIIQAALDKYKKIWLSDGLFNCKSDLRLDSGYEIYLSDNTVLQRGYNSSGATQSSFIRNKDLTVTITDVKIVGAGDIRAATGMGGNMFALRVDRLEMWNTRATNWVGGRYMCLVGDDCYINGIDWECDPNASSGSGGLRFMGGKNFLCENSKCTSGDDVWQFVPAGAPTDPFFNAPDIVNGKYLNCTGRSYDGRLCVAGLQDANDDGTTRLGMKSGVHDCVFENISGFSGKSAFVHQNKSSTGTISGTKTINVVIDRTYATAGQAGEVFMNGVTTTGGVDNIDLSGVTIIGHRTTAGEHDHPIYAAQGKVTNVIKPQGAATVLDRLLGRML